MSAIPEPHARLVVELTEKTHHALTSLSEYEELNKTTIVNRAVQVYQLISELQRGGGVVSFTDSVGKHVHIKMIELAADWEDVLPATPELCGGMGCIQDAGHDGPCLDWGNTP